MRKIVQLFILIGTAFLLFPGNCFAGIENNQNAITGPFATGVTCSAQDSKFTDPLWSSYYTKSIQSTVSLKVLDNVLISTAFTYTANLQIQYYTAPGSAVTTVNTSLTVNYVPGQGAKYKGLDIYNVPLGYKITATVLSSSTTGTAPASSVQLTAAIVIDRSYPFSAATGIGAVYNIANNTKQLQVSWATIPSADEYDVEWTTINNGNSNFAEISANRTIPSTPDNPALSTALAQAFRNNASRTTTSGNNVGISMISTDSLLLVRIRQVQYDKTTGVRVAGNWDYKNGSGYAIWLLNWDEQNQNWQYSAAFAEDGKKKEVISYFDGTLRGRQTVTLNNTDNVAIAQENIYDNFGRPTASILPAPYKEPSLVPYLHYIPNFNENALDSPYTFVNVRGVVPAACELNPDPLNTAAGASQYYSASNDFKTLNIGNNYIPDAAGYPLSVTQYTNDNTGRIRSQGGVGLAFQPGKSGSPALSKTTKYYYGKPEQWELDQLFANDAGYAEHYLKNMVIDPNGQISISYLNASGKTIATALTGKVPSMLDTLPSYHSVSSTTIPQNIHILKPEQFIYDASALTLTANTTYLASVTGVDTLKFNIQKLVDKYPGTFQICSNCYYKMTAVVSDDCGDIAASITTPVKIGDTVSTCADTALYNGLLVVPVNQIGEYNVRLQFAFDPTVIQSYTDTFIQQGLSHGYIQQQFDYIKQRYLDSLNVSGCYSDCHTCTTLLADSAGFVQALQTTCTGLGLDSLSVAGSSFHAWAGGLFHTLKLNCNALQATCSYSPCTSEQDEMEGDVSPGGQYALFDSTGRVLEPGANVLADTIPGVGKPNWRVVFPVLAATDSVYISNERVRPDGTVTSPNDGSFNLQQLITYWQPAWAVKFLSYHPEYCKLQFCSSSSQYQSWDLRVQEDFTKASQVPLIPVASGPPLNYNYTNSSDWLLPADPFFKSGGMGAAYYSQMQSDLLHYSSNVLNITQEPIKGLMAYDDYMLYCVDKTGNTNTGLPVDSNWTQCTPVTSCRVADREWALYSQYYFQLKQKYYQLLQAVSCGSVCPVGQPIVSQLPGSCPVPSEFSVQPYIGTDYCGSAQTAVVVHNPGTLSHSLTVHLYYPSVYNSRTDLIRSVYFPGAGQVTFCVPNDVPISYISVDSVNCGTTPPPVPVDTPLIFMHDAKTGQSTMLCQGGLYQQVQYTSYMVLRNKSGQSVKATQSIDVEVNYTITEAPEFTHYFMIPPGDSVSTSYVYYRSSVVPGTCNVVSVNPDCVLYVYGALFTAKYTSPPTYFNRTCPDFVDSIPPPPTPPVNPCPQAYTVKTPRFPTYTSIPADTVQGITASWQLTAPVQTAISDQAQDICQANAATWISRLQPGLTAMSISQSQINQLTSALIGICSIGGVDQNHPMGASSLPPGQTIPYVNFGAAIQSIILSPGINHYTSVMNPYLIDAPYPYQPLQQSVAKTISNSNAVLCDSLSALTARATTAGQTLYNYLVSTYGSAMTLSHADLDTLVNSCTNCRFMLANDITLPVFLDPGSTGCVLRAAYLAAKDTLNIQFGGTLSTLDTNYQTILSNYMNQRWGFSLTYSDYNAFETGTSPLLCNTLPYTSVNANPYDCVENAVSKAVESGLADYDAYIALQRQNFMTSYINTCSLAKANANMVGVQQEYHYTLYYYDQADNLARTIPPEGVTLVNPNLFSYIDHVRDVDTAAVSYSYNGPETASSLPAALTTLSATLSAATGAVEMWLYNASLNHYHWVEVTPDQKYLFQLGIAGSTLNIDVYPLKSPSATTVQLMPTTGHYQADISAALPLYPFTHVVFQGSSLGSGTTLPQIYLNGQALTVNTSGTPGPFGFTIKVGSSVIIYPDSNQSLKHMRLYNHLLSPATITADAANNYFSATDLSYTGWYRFNIPAPGTPPTTVNGTSDETTNVDLYPGHVLPTSYTYNATNQVTTQQSPDGGTNRFWYDLLSRLVISQNDKQITLNNYSYTQYDSIGRITEVGQKNYTGTTIGSPDYLANTTITAFNTAGTNSQITDTYYDSPVPTVSGNTNGIATLPGQSNLRKRVAASTYTETQGSPVLRATYYNYDIDGNVKTLWQQVDGIYQNSTNTGLKRIDYEYDLVSGKVNFVRYQDGQPDAFYYQYNYDADNRLTKAWSSTTAMVDTAIGSYLPKTTAKQDAAYYYYLHGPLRRMELGDSTSKVQGVDYAYTLQGWLKGVNSTSVQSSQDMGRDSLPIPRDAYGYSLYYYTNDYNPIGGTNPFSTAPAGLSTFNSLYNGNIAAMSTNITKLTDPWHYYTYRYDQLNRLKGNSVYKAGSTATPVTDYQENFTYDGNGNILTATRNAGAATAMDNLTYRYNHNTSGRLTNNELNYITDAVTTHNWPYGLSNQAINNYTYDAIGNMTADVADTISNINWTVYNKIQSLTNSKGTIIYTYDPEGQRVSKTLSGITTWYIRDAQGNALALYDNKHSTINWKEQDLYGSSRLGMWQPGVTLSTNNAQAVWDTTGGKQYELSNHLGNVLATISDKRVQHSSNGTAIDYFDADIVTAQEYYAFGGLMPGRTYVEASNYRYGFNGKENDNDANNGFQDYGQREYDRLIGRFISVDPISGKYPELSTYQFASNSPINFIDIDGLEQAMPKYKRDPISQIIHDINKAIDKKIQQEEEKLSLMSNEEIKDAINKTMATALKHPDEIIINTVKNISKQEDQIPKDARNLLNYAAKGKTDQVSKLAADKIVEYGPWFLFPEEEELKSVSPELFNVEKLSIETPYGLARQALTKDALSLRSQVESGIKLYRVGELGKSEGAEAQFWSTENPLDNPRAYEKKYGLEPGSLGKKNFIEIGTLKKNTSFITRPAPAYPNSPDDYGGGIEVVTPANGVNLESFHIIKK
ncbi:RHS repeat-associated core domain-containing protein [Mucilaginibacter mallensis]|uniref:RHS repeat-associated core domain-containing protein n=1 Tax=Mucilaginibacter mallensis TaxID=652787 RepID=A0A1H1MQJ1_MUCMA|nr:RHS repeat-associated core domain-containing protein [Mucilaginibacter mallensis]SDR89064.1 RHS repeat-associated core domain-containing protein [Mucilaginibacter mallensis]